jgi:hypothetical protein
MDGDGCSDCPGPVELILYVSGPSGCSASAIEQIKNLLARHFSNAVTLTICYVAADPLTARHAVSLAPAVDTQLRGPRTFILGHATNPDLLMEFLEGCGES